MTTTGTIVRKPNGRWYVATHHQDHDGQRNQQWHGGFPTKREAQKKLAHVLAGIQSGRHVAPDRITFREYLEDRWLPVIESSIRPSTYDSYRRNVALHVVPQLGQIRLQLLTPDHLQALYQQLLLAGGRNGVEGLSTKTVRNIHGTIHRALSDAINWDYLVANPAARTTLPSGRRPETAVWEPHHVRAFLAAVASDDLAAAWRLALTTGMRRGEILGLRWKDMDLISGNLQVRQTVVSVAYEIQFSEPKTKRGKRTIPLDGSTVQTLIAHRHQQLEHRLAAGPDWVDLDLVFSRPEGRPIHPDSFTQRFKRLQTQTGLPHIRLHDLRHTFATIALHAGTQPRVVSDLLGHATVAFTLDTYGHAVPGTHQAAVDQVAGLFET